MKISYNWLREIAKLVASPEDVAQALTSLGHAVDTVTAFGEDWVLDVDIPSNRPDCLSAVGLARELAARYGTSLHGRQPDVREDGPRIEGVTTIVVDSPDLCPRYCARALTTLVIGESPAWLKQRVEAAGTRSINNVVDVTNFVMLEMGHPVHAFDLDRLAGHMIRVRRAQPGERLRTLDGVDRVLDPEVLVIADQRGPVALAGIMGGELSEIHMGTKRMLLESALFDPVSVRRTSKRLGLRTEASVRFEKGCDPEAPPRAAERVCRLLQEMGCVVARGYVDVKSATPPPPVIELATDAVTRLLGVALTAEECARHLDSIGFTVRVEAPGTLHVKAPSHRVDISEPVDVIEEIARLHGYDRIPAALPPLDVEPEPPLESLVFEEVIRDHLVAAGLTEVITYSFIQPEGDAGSLIPLRNPISERTHLRDSLLTGLKESAVHNINNGHEDFRFFELGKVFRASNRETAALGVLFSCVVTSGGGWRHTEAAPDFYDVKGVLEGLLERLGVRYVRYRVSERRGDRAGRVEILSDGAMIGCCERTLLAAKHPAYYAELDVDALAVRSRRRVEYRPIVRYPASWRDISFVVDERTEYGTIEQAVRVAAGSELVGLALIDLYRGEHLTPGTKSMTIRLRYQSPERTLTSGEVDALHARSVEAIERLGAVRR